MFGCRDEGEALIALASGPARRHAPQSGDATRAGGAGGGGERVRRDASSTSASALQFYPSPRV
jgi:hypothetical protein